MDLKQKIESAWNDRSLLTDLDIVKAINDTIDQGELRVAEPVEGGWQVNEWIKKAVLLYFPINKMITLEAGPLGVS